MPFCRKCGRRLAEYSERCTDCGTSTTAPIIKIKKSSTTRVSKITLPPKVAKAIIPTQNIISVKEITQNKPVKPPTPAKATPPVKPVINAKPVTPAVVYAPHEIIKSNVSLKKDITTNPMDYETQSFNFNLKCPNDHFWPAGKPVPVSNGKAYCLKCGERLRKPKPFKRRRFHRM